MQSTSPHPLRGVALMMCALLCFAALDTTGKYLSARHPVMFLVWARYLLPWLVLSVVLAPRMGTRLVATRRLPLQVLRAFMLACTSYGVMYGFRQLPMAEGTTLFFITPLIVNLLAWPLLGERTHALHWIGALSGFGGVALISGIGQHALSLPPLALAWMLFASVCYALYQILTRKLADTEHPLTTLYYTAMTGAACSSLLLPAAPAWDWPSGLDAWLVLSLGVSGMVGHFLLIRAFREAPASLLSPLIYFQLLWAGLLGWSVFGHLPSGHSLGGATLIVASGILVLRRAYRRH